MDVQGNEGQTTTTEVVQPESQEVSQPQQEHTQVEGEPQQEQADAANAEDQQQRDEKGRFKSGVQDRINELTRQRHEAEREAAYWRTMAANGTQAQPSAPAAPQKPTPDQFDDYGAYVEALTDWKAEQAVQKRMGEESARRVEQTRASTFQERMAQASQQIADFGDVMESARHLPIATHVIEGVQESEFGPQLLYHFGKNPEALARLNQMDQRTADREIGRLEASFVNKAAPAAPTAKVTKAPAPPSTMGQGRATTPQPADMSMDQYMAMRKSQGARWAN